MGFKILLLLSLLPMPAWALPQMPATNSPAGGWRPWGLDGDIPTYPAYNNVTNYGADPTGVSDSYPAFTNAMYSCPPSNAVIVPPGKYRLNLPLEFYWTNFIVLRGLNVSNTWLFNYSTNSAVDRAMIGFGASSTSSHQSAITDGATNGSLSVYVTNSASFQVGNIAYIYQVTNDPAIIFYSCNGLRSGDTNLTEQMQFVLITNVDNVAKRVDFDRRLCYTYSTNFNLVFNEYYRPCHLCGLENLSLTLATPDTNATAPAHIVYGYPADRCWIVNCILSNSVVEAVNWTASYGCAVKDSIIADHWYYDSLSKYAISLGNGSTDCLIERVWGHNHNLSFVILNYACRNVIAYSGCLYGAGNNYPSSTTTKGQIVFHGKNPNCNLVEGCVFSQASADFFWGATRRNTFFRNYVRRQNYCNDTNLSSVLGDPAVNNSVSNYYTAFINNSYGTARDFGTGGALYSFDGNWANTNSPPWTPPYSCAETNNATYPFDPDVTNTIFLHGNYDLASGSIAWSNSFDQLQPASLYLPSKPKWWGNRLSFPPIGPEVSVYSISTNVLRTNNVTYPQGTNLEYVVNHAEARFFGLVTTATVTAQPANVAVGVNRDAVFSVIGTGTGSLTYQWYSNTVAIAGGTGASVTIPSVKLSNNSDSFYVQITDDWGSTNSNSATLTVFLPTVVNATIQGTVQ